MPLRLFNSKSRNKELFTPIDPSHIKVYVCGPTVYDFVHIGNGFSAVVFDVLYRVLKAQYPKVTYVRNITDIDDRINDKYQQTGEPIAELTSRLCEAYQAHVKQLGCLSPDQEPKATHHINAMLEMIAALVTKKHAYLASGHVLFDVQNYPAYGELSGRQTEANLTGTRISSLEGKKNPADFVLWKPSSDDLPGWDSPWGRGRPGWHLECTAMVHAHLGGNIDIHGGGRDLLFPHHENELAQGRCLNPDCTYAKFWLHNGLLKIDNNKMSKSLGNFTTIANLLPDWDGETLRYALLSGHYRGELEWSTNLLKQAKVSLDKLYRATLIAESENINNLSDAFINIPQDIAEAINDDLNTPLVLALLHKKAADIFKNPNSEEALNDARQLKYSGLLLGLFQQKHEERFQFSKNKKIIDKSKIAELIVQRTTARKAKNFTEADRIRQELAAHGIELEDSQKGVTWHYATWRKD